MSIGVSSTPPVQGGQVFRSSQPLGGNNVSSGVPLPGSGTASGGFSFPGGSHMPWGNHVPGNKLGVTNMLEHIPKHH